MFAKLKPGMRTEFKFGRGSRTSAKASSACLLSRKYTFSKCRGSRRIYDYNSFLWKILVVGSVSVTRYKNSATKW